MDKHYRVWAGEGEQLYLHGEYATLRGARNAARRASCGGDRHAVIERNFRVDVDAQHIIDTEWERIERIA